MFPISSSKRISSVCIGFKREKIPFLDREEEKNNVNSWEQSLLDDFDINLAAELMELSVLAYYDNPEPNLEKLGYEMLLFFNQDDTDTQGFVTRRQNKLVVAFRGTTTFKDLLLDLQMILTKYPWQEMENEKIKVHKGFLTGYESVREQIHSVIADFRKKKDITLFVTGHSLGAALATIAACDLAHIDNFPVVMYNFASPKVGNQEFVDFFVKSVRTFYRVEMKGDPVPLFPLMIGYKHIPHLVFIDENGEIVVNPPMFEQVDEKIDDITSTLLGKAADIHDHHYYLKILNVAKEKMKNANV